MAVTRRYVAKCRGFLSVILSPFVVALLRAGSAKAPLSRGRAKPAEAPSAAEGEGSTRSDSPAASLFK
jgi:hypothetical protein